MTPIETAHSNLTNAVAFLESLVVLKDTAAAWKATEAEAARLEKSNYQKGLQEKQLTSSIENLKASHEKLSRDLMAERTKILDESREKLNAQETDLTGKIAVLEENHKDLKEKVQGLAAVYESKTAEEEKKFQALKSSHSAEISSLVAKREELEALFQGVQSQIATRRKLA